VGLLIVKAWALDVPPPPGLVTVTFTVPAAAISAAGMVAKIWVLVTDVGVIAGFAPKFTVAPVTKPVPVRVNGKAAPPAVAAFGAIEARLREAPLIVKGKLPDVPPPGAGFVTTTLAVPAVAISAAVIAAVSWVALISVVVLIAP